MVRFVAVLETRKCYEPVHRVRRSACYANDEVTYYIVRPDQKPRRFYEEATREYEKRLSRFCKARRLDYKEFGRINERDFFIHISSGGIRISSEEMAIRLKMIESSGRVKRIIFLINPCSGIRMDEMWALTTFCLPADLQTVLLIEQIYRAHKIIYKEPYHK